MPPPVTDLDDADEETTLAWLIQEAFKQICTTTSILANGEGHLNSYDIENYRCEARDLISDPSGPQIDPSNRIQWHKYRIPAVKMQVCRDIHGSPPDWLACSRSVNPWELPGHVFATIPGPTLAGVVGPHGQAIPEHATGMAEFCNKGCWVTVWTTSRIQGRPYRHALSLTQIEPLEATLGPALPREMRWEGQYHMYSWTCGTNVEIPTRTKFFKFTAELRRGEPPKPVTPQSKPKKPSKVRERTEKKELRFVPQPRYEEYGPSSLNP